MITNRNAPIVAERERILRHIGALAPKQEISAVAGLQGKHYLYLVMDGGAGICNLERFRFVGAR